MTPRTRILKNWPPLTQWQWYVMRMDGSQKRMEHLFLRGFVRRALN